MRARITVIGMSLALAVATTALAAAQDLRCQRMIGTKARAFVAKHLRLVERCRLQDLATPASCPAPDGSKLARLQAQLRDGVAAACGDVTLADLGFPGECADLSPGDFTLGELQDCIDDSHTAIAGALADVELDPTVVGPLDGPTLVCQRTIVAAASRFLDAVMKSVQRCRNDILAGRLALDPTTCAVGDPKTSAAIAKARAKARARILSKCDSAAVTALEACEPDQAAAEPAADCILDAKQDAADNIDPPGLIQYEFPPPATPTPTATPGICCDGHVNRPAEECDGADDAACPGQCGACGGFFECLCLTIPRERIVEHANADLDIGWTGLSHDSKIVEGGGYTADLWDCDGPGGPDTLCTVGPSCSLPPHAFCRSTKNGAGANVGPPYEDADAICASLGQGTCRKTRGGAMGPHCEIQFQKECDTDLQCPLPGDRCVKTFHGAPLPITAGSVKVCIENTFSEDVVGTTDLASGAGAVRVRQISKTYLALNGFEPCPVCGGYCEASNATELDPGGRLPCKTDADCFAAPHVCVHEAKCSFGQNIDEPCRPDPPFGGPTVFFGNPSIDCPSSPATTVAGRPDILFDPATTSDVTSLTFVPCMSSGFGKECSLGVNDARPCATAGDCPGGTCQERCNCPAQPQPNACEAACRGGSNDAELCDVDPDCPGGFCHVADCRLNPADTDSVQEGVCTVGPLDEHCSKTLHRSCSFDSECARSTACPTCQADETCVSSFRECFLNPIERAGAPGVTGRVGAAIFCVPSSAPAVNTVAGLPGPGALTQPETTLDVGF